MAYIPVPLCAQLELIYSWASQQCETVLHYTKDDAWTPTQLQSLADVAITTWVANVRPWCGNTLSLTSVVATDLQSQSGASITRAGGLPSAGTQTGDVLPNNCALVVTKRTQNRGRSFRGRIYHPAIPEAQISGNSPSGAYVTGVVNGWNAFLALTIAGPLTAQLVVVSRFTNNSPRVTGITTPVISLTSDGVMDSQRRRLPGRGK